MALVSPHHEPVWIAPSSSRAVERTGTVQALGDALSLESLHGPRPRRLADAEDLIVAELARASRPVVMLDAHKLRTVSLTMLYGMWAHRVPGKFALVITGPAGELEQVINRPALASLQSCVFSQHRILAGTARYR